MKNVSVAKRHQRRRHFSHEFKAEIGVQCLEPGASVAQISLDNGLNANMVRRWISERVPTLSFRPRSYQWNCQQGMTALHRINVAPSVSRYPVPAVQLIEWPAD